MKKHYIILLALAFSLFFVSCDEDDDTPIVTVEESITDIAVANSELSLLVEALTRLGLDATFDEVGTAEYTVLAPNNTAFQALLDSEPTWNSIADIPEETLRMVLNYHVISGEVMSTDLTDGWATTLAMGPNNSGISLQTTVTGGVMFDDAGVVTADRDADNGVIHVIDKVLMPKNLLERAMSLDNFSILVQAVQADGLSTNFVAALDGTAPLTVFAPDNMAFMALLESNESWNQLSDIDPSLLDAVLRYHVSSGNTRSTQLTDGMAIPTLLEGQGYIFNATNTTLTTTSGQTVSITATDIQTTNGVIHVVQNVLLPMQ